MKNKIAAPPTAPVPVNPFDAWTSECLAAAIKAVTGTADFVNDKAAQASINQMTSALQARPVVPDQQKAAAATERTCKTCGGKKAANEILCKKCAEKALEKKKGSTGGYPSYNKETGVIKEGDKSIPSSRAEEELQGLDKSGKITRPETVLPEKFASEKGVRSLMGSLVLAAAE